MCGYVKYINMQLFLDTMILSVSYWYADNILWSYNKYLLSNVIIVDCRNMEPQIDAKKIYV